MRADDPPPPTGTDARGGKGRRPSRPLDRSRTAAICGRQDPPRQRARRLSHQRGVVRRFRVSTLEARPAWPADTGIMLRATADGSTGYQVLVDHRKSGNIGGFYGNGIGRFHAINYNVDVERDAGGQADRPQDRGSGDDDRADP